jgi:hypothetical protein
MTQLHLFDPAPYIHPPMLYVAARSDHLAIGVSHDPTAIARQLQLLLLWVAPLQVAG